MIEGLVKQALDCWDQVYPSAARPAKLDFVVQSRHQIIVFLFARELDAKHPVLVSKVARTTLDNPRLVRSARLVQQLRLILAEDLLATIPIMIVAGDVVGLTHIVMSPVRGDPMVMPTLRPGGYRLAQRQVRAYGSWLLEFQRQTLSGKQALSQAEWFDKLSPTFLETLGTSWQTASIQNLLRELCAALAGTSLSLVWRYGDAHNSNLLFDGGQLTGVVDWDGAGPGQWAIHDWYYFTFMYALEFFKKNSRLTGFALARQAVDCMMGAPCSWLGPLLSEETRRFLESQELDPDLTHAFFLVFLAQLYWPWQKDRLLEHAAQTFLLGRQGHG